MKGRKRQTNRKNLGGVIKLSIHGNPRKRQPLHFSDRDPDATKAAPSQFAGSHSRETFGHSIKMNQINNLTECAIALSDLKGLSVFMNVPIVESDWPVSSSALFLKSNKIGETKSIHDGSEKKSESHKKRKQSQTSASDESKKFRFLSPSGVYVNVATAPRSRPDLRHGVASHKETKSSDLLSSTSDGFSTGRIPHPIALNYSTPKKMGFGDEDFGAIGNPVNMGHSYTKELRPIPPAPSESKSASMELEIGPGNLDHLCLRRRLEEPSELDDSVIDDYAAAQILSERFGSAAVVRSLFSDQNSLEKVQDAKGENMGSKIVLEHNSPMPMTSNPESNLSQTFLPPSSIPYMSCSTPDSVSGPTESFKLERSNETCFVSFSNELLQTPEHEFMNHGEATVTARSDPNAPVSKYAGSSPYIPNALSPTQVSPIVVEKAVFPGSLSPSDFNSPDTQDDDFPTLPSVPLGCRTSEFEFMGVTLKSGGALKPNGSNTDQKSFCSRSSFVFLRQNRPKFDTKTFQSLSKVKSTSGVYVYKRNKCDETSTQMILHPENATNKSVPC